MGSTIALADAAKIESSFLPAGWEIKVVSGNEEPDAPAPAARLIAADEKTGEVTAIVGITGVVDHVNDLIEPGAYQNTLTKRRPKVCWAHSWEVPIGKVLRIEEWLPGDPRFAKVGATLDGKAWPVEAGALVAHMQMNLKSEKGKEAFSAVQFYSETGECEWSIGWQPIPAKTLRRKDGVRVCKSVELYEVSPVLFGAAPLTRTLEVKALNLAAATPRGIKPRAGVAAGTQDEDPNTTAYDPANPTDAAPMAPLNEAAPVPGEGDPLDEATLHHNAMPEIDWAQVDAAADTSTAPPGPGTPALAADPNAQPAAGDEDAVDGGVDDAEEGDGADADPDGDGDTEGSPDDVDEEDDEPVDSDVEDAAEEDAADGGADDDEENPDGTPKKKPTGSAPPFVKKKGNGFAVDVKALTAFTDGLDFTAYTGLVLPEVKAEGGADQNRGNAEQLRRWYVEGEGAQRISWGTPGDFSRCTEIAGKHMGERAKGYCNLRHKDALGIYPATHAAQDRGSVAGKAYAAAATLAKSWNPLLEVGAYAAHGRPEVKFMAEGIDGLQGSFEQRQSVLRRELDEVLKGAIGWTKPEPTPSDGMAAMKAPDDCWVSIEGTWPDRVVATICRYGEDQSRTTFIVPYTFTGGDEVEFGKPQAVELQVSIVPTDAADADDAQDILNLTDDDDDTALGDALVLPAISLLGSGMGALKTALLRAPEVKAGRVLSEANASRLRGALEHLLEVARSAGIDLPGWTGPDPTAVDDNTPPDTTAPEGPASVTGPGARTAVKTLSPADLQAALQNFL